jgi:ribosomal protein S18 acetylase RimI-like enzyme
VNGLTIRTVALADVPDVRRVLVETWHATYDATMGAAKVTEITDRWHSADALARQAEEPDCAFLLAERDGEVVGTSLMRGCDGVDAVLHRLYVHPDEQGRGTGQRLLEATLARFPDAPAVTLEVEPYNRRAIRLYERQGFEAVGEFPECGGDMRLRALRMVKRLAPAVRLARDDDAQDLFGLLALCFAEHTGCFVDPHDDLPDLLAPGSAFAAKGGAFWVVEDVRGRVAACIAVDFPDPDTAELHRLYVRLDARRRGLGARLVGLVEERARGQGASRVVFWSDTRFTDAHRLYERLGYERRPETRELGDISGSVEARFEKALP